MGRPRKYPRRWYRCIESFDGGFNAETGKVQRARVGDLLPETDLLVKANPDWFEALDHDYPIPPEVEAAESGDKRGS